MSTTAIINGPVMDSELWPYRAVLIRQANELCDLLVRRLIRVCQAQPMDIGAEGLNSLWDEICLAVRSDHPMTETYRGHLIKHLTALIEALPAIQRQMLWVAVHDEAPDTTAFPDRCPDKWPLIPSLIARRVVASHVMFECANYENARIRAAEGR